MLPHPYLRAYMAGIVLPSVVVFFVGLLVACYFFEIPAAIERAMIFPMALNGFIWGLWNVLYVRLPWKTRLPIGWHGALLSMLLIAAGIMLAPHFQLSFVTPKRGVAVFPPTALAYYVLWKYGVRFLNDLLGLTCELKST